jgi:hypothetical protein
MLSLIMADRTNHNNSEHLLIIQELRSGRGPIEVEVGSKSAAIRAVFVFNTWKKNLPVEAEIGSFAKTTKAVVANDPPRVIYHTQETYQNHRPVTESDEVLGQAILKAIGKKRKAEAGLPEEDPQDPDFRTSPFGASGGR